MVAALATFAPSAALLQHVRGSAPRSGRGGVSGKTPLFQQCAAAAAAPVCRCRRCLGRCGRCCTRVMAFRWGDSPSSSPSSDTATTDPTATKPNANNNLKSNANPKIDFTNYDDIIATTQGRAVGAPDAINDEDSTTRGPTGEDRSGGVESQSPLDEVLEGMRREGRKRDVQRAVVAAAEGAMGWWRDLPDKRSAVGGGAGLVVAAYLGSVVLMAVDRVPLIPGLLQLVGFGYSCWFFFHYLLFADGRKELRLELDDTFRILFEGAEELAGMTVGGGSGDTGPATSARRVVNRMATVRHHHGINKNNGSDSSSSSSSRSKNEIGNITMNPATAMSNSKVAKDDGSWVDEPPALGITGLDERYVTGLIEAGLDKPTVHGSGSSSPSTAGGGGGGGSAGRMSPSVFAFLVVSEAMILMAPEMGAEEAAVSPSGGGTNTNPTPDSSSGLDPRSGSGSGSGSYPISADTGPSRSEQGGGGGGDGSGGGSEQHQHAAMADLDPCLGWDVEACARSGHLKLGQPDESKLDSLEQAALRQAKEAVGFSRHVDEVLHETTSHKASLESVHLEGEYGRAAGTMEREVMEDLAARNPDGVMPLSTRKPAVGEEAGTGP